jgi:hypothetical protein
MAAATRSLATALWGARFASGLLPRSYTTNRDTTCASVFLAKAGREKTPAKSLGGLVARDCSILRNNSRRAWRVPNSKADCVLPCAAYIPRNAVAYLPKAFKAHSAGWVHPSRSAGGGRQASGWPDWIHEVKHDAIG